LKSEIINFNVTVRNNNYFAIGFGLTMQNTAMIMFVA